MAHGLGIDIGRGAWAIVEAETDDKRRIKTIDARSAPYNKDITVPSRASVVIVDIPVGLLDNEDGSPTDKGLSGDREVDKGARRWCPSTSSVFPPPTKSQLASAIQEHNRARREGERKRKLSNVEPGGLSYQSLELAPAIEAGRELKGQLPAQVFESHPEVVFSVLARGILPAGKKSLLGGLARVALLRDRCQFDALSWVLKQECVTKIPADNWIDALAMAVVALDWASGERLLLRTRDGAVHRREPAPNSWTPEM